jgi:hypothetical protein
MATDSDRYEAWYTEKLWALIPELYRAEDSDDFDVPGPLRELVARIGVQAAIVRRSIDRLWEDQSIESCEDWVVDYIGDLLDTNLIAGLDGAARRADVGKTIYYRRRKGTLGVLEELASDLTGWSVRVVEQFRRLGRTRHGLDPAIGLPALPGDPRGRLQRVQGLVGERTRTAAGGFADLRDVYGAGLTDTAFDEYFHTADVRRGRGATGRYAIPRLAVFAWRAHSFGVAGVSAVQDAACANQYTFDPTGRDIPLFALGDRPYGDTWVSPAAHQVPGPISDGLLTAAFDDLYAPRSLGVSRFVGGPQPTDYLPVPPGEVTRDPRQPTGRFFIDPERGRLIAPVGVHDGPFLVDYHYGFTSEIGAGPYDRRMPGDGETPAPRGPEITEDADLAAQLTGLAGTGTVTLGNSRTFTKIADVNGVRDVLVCAANGERPLIRPATATWIFTGQGDAVMAFDGLFLSGADLVLRGSFDHVALRCCTLDPGTWDPGSGTFATAADGKKLTASRLRVEGTIRVLEIERCILGPVDCDADQVETLKIGDSIVQASDPADTCLTLASGEAELWRTTLIGPAEIHRLEAGESILSGRVRVDDTQHGCVRFSAWTAGSTLPRKYESVMLAPNTALFASVAFGRPDYAQPLATAGPAVLEGGEDGGELGAFAREGNAVKERGLLIKYQEYMPIGLEPVVVQVT